MNNFQFLVFLTLSLFVLQLQKGGRRGGTVLAHRNKTPVHDPWLKFEIYIINHQTIINCVMGPGTNYSGRTS